MIMILEQLSIIFDSRNEVCPFPKYILYNKIQIQHWPDAVEIHLKIILKMFIKLIHAHV